MPFCAVSKGFGRLEMEDGGRNWFAAFSFYSSSANSASNGAKISSIEVSTPVYILALSRKLMQSNRLVIVRLLSTAATGFSYVARRPRTAERKLAFMKFDPKAGKHVLFVEAKLK